MHVIPVIDLKGGEVVHARGGRRHEYRPIETPLAPSSTPEAVVAGLLRLFPFGTLYVADLDAIGGNGHHSEVLAMLARAFPAVSFWVDSGIADEAYARTWLARGLGALVLGTESQTGTEVLRALAPDPRVVLSMDYRGEMFQGPADIETDLALWPARVIVMTLARVGAGGGPDLARISASSARAGGRAIYAAGGVRDANDLRAAAKAGASGALVATALHHGRITADDLNDIARPPGPGAAAIA